MARPDLSPGYGGWQAVDATPQELSRGKVKFDCQDYVLPEVYLNKSYHKYHLLLCGVTF